MKTYTEQDVREAFKKGATQYSKSPMGIASFILFEVDKYIESLNDKEIEEDKISFTYSFLRRKLDWLEFCELTGTNEWAKKEGREFQDDEIFYIIESKAKQFNLI